MVQYSEATAKVLREAEMKLEEAVEKGSPSNIILDLAADWCNARQKKALQMGFRLATKLLKEGLC